MRFIPIKTYLSASMAHVDKGILAEQGIVAVVENENAIGSDGLLLTALGNIQLSVTERDLEAAQALLGKENYVDQEGEGESYVCPACGSQNISDYAPYMWTILVPVLFPLLFIKRTVCHACRHRWKRG